MTNDPTYYVTAIKSSIIQANGDCTIKHGKFVMYRNCCKLMCWSKPVEVTDNSNKTLVAYRISPFTIHQKYVMPLKGPGVCIIKLITAIIYGFRNKLERLFLNTRLGCKGLPESNTLAYCGNHKLRP
jgi:hypothetical protein